jgi:hypothetical protein
VLRAEQHQGTDTGGDSTRSMVSLVVAARCASVQQHTAQPFRVCSAKHTVPGLAGYCQYGSPGLRCTVVSASQLPIGTSGKMMVDMAPAATPLLR